MSEQNPNIKDTKATILTAYENMVKKLEEKNSHILDPEKIACDKKIEEALASANSAIGVDFAKAINKLHNDGETISLDLLVLKDIQNTIKVKKLELKEMYDIDKSINTLASLVNSQRDIKDGFEEDMSARKTKLEQELKDLQVGFVAEENKFKKDMIAKSKESTNARIREENEWIYDFGRQKQFELDKHQDSLDALEKTHSEMVTTQTKELVERENLVEARETKVDDLENEISTLIASREKDITEAIEKEKKREAKSSNFKVQLAEKDTNGKIALLESQIAILTTNLETEKERNITLANKLDNAYGEMKELAKETVSSKKTEDAVRNMQNSNNTNNK